MENENTTSACTILTDLHHKSDINLGTLTFSLSEQTKASWNPPLRRFCGPLEPGF